MSMRLCSEFLSAVINRLRPCSMLRLFGRKRNYGSLFLTAIVEEIPWCCMSVDKKFVPVRHLSLKVFNGSRVSGVSVGLKRSFDVHLLFLLRRDCHRSTTQWAESNASARSKMTSEFAIRCQFSAVQLIKQLKTRAMHPCEYRSISIVKC